MHTSKYTAYHDVTPITYGEVSGNVLRGLLAFVNRTLYETRRVKALRKPSSKFTGACTYVNEESGGEVYVALWVH